MFCRVPDTSHGAHCTAAICTICTASSEWARVERHVENHGEEGAPVNGQSTVSPALDVPLLVEYALDLQMLSFFFLVECAL